MASRWRNGKRVRPSTWRQALLFNALCLMLPVFAANIVTEAFTSSAITNPNGIEARSETRIEIDRAFTSLRRTDETARQDWALRIDRSVAERDFSAARGYLLAAPNMLNSADSRAVMAAAAAEEQGTQDERLVRAALLFLPDPVRANYQRAVSPPAPPAPEPESEPAPDGESDAAEDATDGASDDTPVDVADALPAAPVINDLGAALPREERFSILGDRNDLVRRSQTWIRDPGVDDVQLRLRALGLIAQDDAGGETVTDFEQGVTVLLSARRASRLSPRFASYIESRVEDALPRAVLRQQLQTAFEPILPSPQRAERILDDYRAAIEATALERLNRDMEIIATLAEQTSTTGALTLVEQTSSPEDMRRILLVTQAGGDRAVALAKEFGPDTLNFAQIGVKWSTALVLQVMALAALGMALLLTMLSTVTRAERLSR